MPRRGHRHRPYRLSGHNLLVALRVAACRQQRGLCYWYGAPMRTDVEPMHSQFCTADHLVPRYAGGKTVAGNIVAACRVCNNGRHAFETNRRRASEPGLVLSIGDNTPSSPFEVLARQRSPLT
jgi:5-methylcytosine-specific restriction endonuclease McrA